MRIKALILSLTILVIAGMIVIILQLAGVFEGENYTIKLRGPEGAYIVSESGED